MLRIASRWKATVSSIPRLSAYSWMKKMGTIAAAWINVKVNTKVEYVKSLKWWRPKGNLPSVPSDWRRITKNGIVLLRRMARANMRTAHEKPMCSKRYLRITG